MKRRLLFLALAFPGWLMLGLYLYYDYLEHGRSIVKHFLSLTPVVSLLFHVLMLTTPFVSIAFAYFVIERSTLVSGLKAAERRYRDYYDNAPYGYHSADGDMVVLDVNQTWLDMLGYEMHDVVGVISVPELMTPDSRKRLKRIYAGFKEAGRIDDLELEFVRKDGSVLPVLVSSTAVFDKGEFIRSRTIIKDNRDRKTFEQILRGVAEHWENTFNSMPWGVMILDSRCNVLRFNEYFMNNNSIEPADLAKKYCCKLIDESPDVDDVDQTYEAEFHDKDHDKYYKLTGRMIYSSEITQNYVFNITEISDIRRSEKKLADSRNAFFNMLKDASAAYKELDKAYRSMILSFANAIDAKSPWTKGHSERVSSYAIALAEAMGIDRKALERVRMAALLHDIGKIGTFDYLLEKPDQLTENEYDVVKRHPEESARILRPIEKFRDIVDIVKYHHEHYDGTGYPEGLKGEDIPLFSRVLCLADSYDSMIADRPYRSAQDRQYAIVEIRQCAGSHFDPVLAEKFIELIEKQVI